MKISNTALRTPLLDAAFLVRLISGIALVLVGSTLTRASTITSEADLPAMSADEARSGTLLFKSNVSDGRFVAPLLKTDVDIEVSGMIARAKVRQTFANPFDDWYEAVYVFPLPENAAVDHLRLRIGERIFEGVIRERGEAKKAYERARDAGQRAALLEQERPNIFTTSVANIGPQQKIVVEIEYQQTLKYDSGRFSLRFPMVVGPRYIPGTVPFATDTGTGWSHDTDEVPDASRITPPVLPPEAGPINPVSLRVKLDAGVPLAAVASSYHPIREQRVNDRTRIVELADRVTPANRDFVLEWQPALGAAPQTAWFTEKTAGKTYGLLMLMPPQSAPATHRIAREVIFVIDTSGSMEGTSMQQAKEALALAIDRLPLDDRFNVIEFNSVARKLFTDARPATADNLDVARQWVGNLNAGGGTEIALALDLVLDGKDQAERIRQIVFLTDGEVGNEDALFQMIRSRLGDSRLFTVGIGSAPNGHFMTKAAEVGRGTFTYIGKVGEVGARMGELFAKLESPVLKGIRIDWPAGARAEAWPKYIPDLYVGEPVVVTVELSRDDGRALKGNAVVTGASGVTPWSSPVSLVGSTASAGVGALWARNKIEALVDAQRDGTPEDEIRPRVIEVALAHHLVSKYTSLVAIDPQPVRPASARQRRAAMPTNLPAGWVHEAQWGELPRGATDSRFNLLVGLMMLLAGCVLWRPALRAARVG
jgi:Ca-activated chloride channel family protein